MAGEISAPPRILNRTIPMTDSWNWSFFTYMNGCFYGKCIGKSDPWIPKNPRSTEWNWSIYQDLLSLKLTARTCKRMVGRLRLVYLVSFWDGFLAGAMFQGVYPLNYPDV